MECELEAGTVQSAGEVQRAIADAYRAKVTLLTSMDIKALRKARGLTQQELAARMNVGIASIKRWETGMIQSRSMDKALRMQLQGNLGAENDTGNRKFSLARVKLVAKAFEDILNRRLLKVGDKFLYLAKYLWYADMIAFRQLGKSLTGGSYAALPFGPQLNNYRDLVKPIKGSNILDAEPLSDEELQIIRQVAEHFPAERDVYDAAHRENVWKEAGIGDPIPYTCACQLTEI
jgi:DNA-binding transcriptional regulator YiaG